VPRDARQAAKVIQKLAGTRRTDVPSALVKSRTRVEAELLPTLREDQEIHISFRADGDVLLRPLNHVIHKHPGDQVRRLITQQADPRLRPYGRRPPICADKEPAREPMFNPVQLEGHRRLGSWLYRCASDPPDDRRPRGLCGAMHAAG
jgi:hypothetical protein